MVESTYEMREAVRQARLDVFGVLSGRQASTPRAGTRRAQKGLIGSSIVEYAESRPEDYNLKGYEAVAARQKWIDEGAAKRLGGTTRTPRHRPIKRSVGERIAWQRGDSANVSMAGDGDDDEGRGDDEAAAAGGMSGSAGSMDDLDDLESGPLAPLGKFMEIKLAAGAVIDRQRGLDNRLPPVHFAGAAALRSAVRLLESDLPEGVEQALVEAGRGPDGSRLDGLATDDEWPVDAPQEEPDEGQEDRQAQEPPVEGEAAADDKPSA